MCNSCCGCDEHPDALYIKLTLSVFSPFSLSLSLCLQYNFVGRILGPRGLTAKQLEAETGCKIMVRGKSSMRDKKKVKQSQCRPFI